MTQLWPSAEKHKTGSGGSRLNDVMIAEVDAVAIEIDTADHKTEERNPLLILSLKTHTHTITLS